MKKKFRFLSLFIFLSGIYSCNTTPDAKSDTDTAIGHPESIVPVHQVVKRDSLPVRMEMPIVNDFGCYYLQGKQYADDDTSGFFKWKNDLLDNIEHYGIGKNIFSHKGAGPNGAEWNADAADLFLVVTTPEILKNDYPHPMFVVTMNDKEFETGKINYRPAKYKEGTLIFLTIPSKTRMKFMRPIQKSDYASLYGKNYKDTTYIAPLNTGEIVKFFFYVQDVNTGKKITFTKYFHSSGGE